MKSLQNRWTEAETTAINEVLAQGNVAELAVPRVRIEGREYVDLRGLNILKPIRERQFVGIDFSHCIAGVLGQFIESSLEDCLFVGAKLNHTNLWVTAQHCCFDKATFHVLGTSFEECSFVKAKMSQRMVRDSQYVRCDFTNSKWRRALALYHMFDHCIWNGCEFRDGSFAGSLFIGTQPLPSSLNDTIMDDVRFEPSSE